MTKLASSQLIGANFSFQHYPFETCAAAMRDFGFTQIELWGAAPHLDIFRATDGDVKALKNCLDRYGLGVRSLTPEQVLYPVNIASGDNAYRDASIAHFMRAAEIAATLGSDYLFLTPGRGFENEPGTCAWDRSAEALGKIVTYVKNLGLRCLLEPLQRVESNVVNDAAGLARMLEDIPADTVDVVLDTVAMATAGDTVQDYLRLFKDRLTHVQLVDGTPAGHLVWGDGDLPMGGVIDELIAGEYTGTLTFEPFGDGTYALDPQDAWARNIAAVAPYRVNNGAQA